MPRHRHKLYGGAALIGLLAALGPGALTVSAAPPAIGDVWASQVQTTTARLSAEVDPGGKASTYRFDYISRAAYEANLAGAKDGFSGASRLPASGTTAITGTAPTTISPLLFGLAPRTEYRYRLLVFNADGTATGGPHDLATFATATFSLPDGRGWEMVSPLEKNGGGVADPDEAGGGTSRAAVQGGAVAFASKASFAGGGGAAPFSQYIASRAAGGWQTQNLTPAHLAGAYEGAPYVAFSADLGRSLYLNPARCPAGDPCAAGYRLRENPSGALLASPTDPGLFAAASPDLRHVVFAKAGELYRWSPPAGLVDLNAGPSVSGPPAFVATDGQRIYYQGTDGNLHLRAGAVTAQIDDMAGGGGALESATPDGARALFTRSGHLHLYNAATDTSVDLVPSGGVVAGSARIGSSGTKVLFASTTPLETADGATYDNTELGSGDPASQVYLYDVSADALHCVSCNPTHARPLGPSTVPGAAAPHAPRVLSADGNRVFFDSDDALVLSDVNLSSDVYQWTAPGSGGCAQAGGCVALISAGLAGSSSFVDASASGEDVFFLTDRSLVGADSGAVDLYDARVGGGFPEPGIPPSCIGDACQVVPAAPEDPTMTTTLKGPGNPAERYLTYGEKRKSCPKGKRLRSVRTRKGKRVRRCVKTKAKPGRRQAGRRR